jgi:hypothetical protein
MPGHGREIKLLHGCLLADKRAVARAMRKVRQHTATGGRPEIDDDDALAEVAEAVFLGRSDWQATTAVARKRTIPQRRLYRKFKERRGELLAAVDPRVVIARALWPTILPTAQALHIVTWRLYDALSKIEYK